MAGKGSQEIQGLGIHSPQHYGTEIQPEVIFNEKNNRVHLWTEFLNWGSENWGIEKWYWFDWNLVNNEAATLWI